MRLISPVFHVTTSSILLTMALGLTACTPGEERPEPPQESALASLNGFSDGAEGCMEAMMDCVEGLEDPSDARESCQPEFDFCLAGSAGGAMEGGPGMGGERPDGPTGMDSEGRPGAEGECRRPPRGERGEGADGERPEGECPPPEDGPGMGGPGEGGPGGGPGAGGPGRGGPGMGGSGGPGMGGPGGGGPDGEERGERRGERGEHPRGVSPEVLDACLAELRACVESDADNDTCFDAMHACVHTALEADFDAMCAEHLTHCEESDAPAEACAEIAARCEDGVPHERPEGGQRGR